MGNIKNNELYVLNTNFETVDVVDDYQSLIWTDRYYAAGEFEIYTSPESSLLKSAVKDYYIYKKDSEHMMIVEDLTIESDTEIGNHLKITGRSLESILDRRCVWNQTRFNGNLQNGIKSLITASITSPSIADRKISNFIFKESTDEKITKLTMDKEYTGDYLLDLIEDLCQENEIGFKITLDENHNFVFELYNGTDRSYKQNAVPYVVFSPKFENIINSNYYNSVKEMKNVALVAGEGEGAARTTVVVGSGSGLTRRELFVDARDLRSDDISTAQYLANLRSRGEEKLKEVKEVKNFEGEVESTILYRYNEHFFMGDIVQIANEYGIEGRARIAEFVTSESNQGRETYPTFTMIEDEEETS